MSRIMYKVLINNDVIAIFYELEDVTLFIKALCEKYYEEIKKGFNFTIKEEIEDE